MKNYKNYLILEDNAKYKEINEEEFIKLFKENCKNFSLNNDPLYRGDMEKFDFAIHISDVRRSGYFLSYSDMFDKQEKDMEKYPVIRNNSMMGLGGAKKEEMLKICSKIGGHTNKISSPVYDIIPFDNSKIVFCPIFDLFLLEFYDIELTDDDFVTVEYTKDFKVPVEKLKNIQNKFDIEKMSKDHDFVGNEKIQNKGFEFYMSSPALLIPVDDEKKLEEYEKL